MALKPPTIITRSITAGKAYETAAAIIYFMDQLYPADRKPLLRELQQYYDVKLALEE